MSSNSNKLFALIFSLAFSSVLATPFNSAAPPQSSACGNDFRNESYNAMYQFHDQALSPRAALPDAGSHIKVHWNVIYKDDSEAGGNIPEEKIRKQIAVLNQDFKDVGLTFELQEIKRTRALQPSWYTFILGWPEEKEVKKTMVVDGFPAVLRVYSLEPAGGISFSTQLTHPPNPDVDGVVLNRNRMVSDKEPGHTLTHEVGHWSGLFHVFEGGCNKPGDMVDDTPAYEHSDFDATCDKPRYECGESKPAPTDNFMSYSIDTCRTRFTPGQIERMGTQLKRYRGITLGKGKGATTTTIEATDDNKPEVTGSSTGNMNADKTNTVTGKTQASKNGVFTAANSNNHTSDDLKDSTSTISKTHDISGASSKKPGDTTSDSQGPVTLNTTVCKPKEIMKTFKPWVTCKKTYTFKPMKVRINDCHEVPSPPVSPSGSAKDSDSKEASGTNTNDEAGTKNGPDTKADSKPAGGTLLTKEKEDPSTTSTLATGTSEGKGSTASDESVKSMARKMYKEITGGMTKLWEFMNKHRLF